MFLISTPGTLSHPQVSQTLLTLLVQTHPAPGHRTEEQLLKHRMMTDVTEWWRIRYWGGQGTMLVTETDELFKLVESSVLDTTVEMIRTGTALEIKTMLSKEEAF